MPGSQKELHCALCHSQCSTVEQWLHQWYRNHSDMLQWSSNPRLKTQIWSVCHFLSDSADSELLLRTSVSPRPDADWSFSGSSSSEGEGGHCANPTHIVVLFAPGIIKFGTHGNKYRSEPDLKGEFSICLSAKTFRGPDLRRGPALEKQRDRCKHMMSAAFSPLPKTPLISPNRHWSSPRAQIRGRDPSLYHCYISFKASLFISLWDPWRWHAPHACKELYWEETGEGACRTTFTRNIPLGYFV